LFARVVIDTGGRSSLDSLTYLVPDGLARRIGIGSCVLVPLSSRQAVGYVIGFEDNSDVDGIKPIISDLDSPVTLSPEMLDFARWLSAEYLCPLPRAVAGMLPGVMHCKVQCRIELISSDGNLSPSQKKLAEKIENLRTGSGEYPTVEALCARTDRSAVLRGLRELESRGAIKRSWRLVSPTGKPRKLRGVRLAGNPPQIEKLPAGQRRALEVISRIGRDVSFAELVSSHGVSRAVLKGLRDKGLVEETEIIVRRRPSFTQASRHRPALMPEQENAVRQVSEAIDGNLYQGFLLHGVTASGKTEVYLRCIERALSAGKSALVLLPEIAITTQVTNIFKSWFGDRVAILHSALSAGERCDEWARVDSGEADVVIGARSAVFAPLENLGLVVVDEEHESSYKQDVAPRYHAREAAAKRARDAGAALVLGSATPCVESYFRAQSGEYTLIEMPTRVENRPMPTVHVADLRQEYAEVGPTIFSRLLEDGIRDRIAKGQQVILLQNRRAYSTFLLCRDCGFVMRCPNCAVSLKFYSESRRLSCHHCDYTRPAPDVCPKCSGLRIGRFGIGTERVAEEAQKRFPEARVIRMDSDTTSRKGAHASLLDQFRRGDADILVGTQMIAKGLDFPNVTLVGVISADTSINLPDYSASERTFQLVSQVSGRSGRGTEMGEVVVQSFDPENYAISCAVNHDYAAFYEEEIENRRAANYPPFASLVNIVARDKDERAAEAVLRELVRALDAAGPNSSGVEINGPVPAVLSRLRGEYRWHIVLRSADRTSLLAVLSAAFHARPDLRRRLVVDVDPVSML
jgi:primosomal protein N' (replication factor Y)